MGSLMAGLAVATTLASCKSGGTHASAPTASVVGWRTETFVDPSRPTAATKTEPQHQGRTLRTDIFYPARSDRGSTTSAGVDATPVAGRRLPMIVFAHGLGGTAFLSEGLIRGWVARGYVVAAPDFPLTNIGTPGGIKIEDYVNQPADVTFVITEVLRLGSRPGDPFRGLIDSDRIGVIGHSFGAVTVLGIVGHACCADPRVTAAVALSGRELPFPGDAGTATGKPQTPTPLLFVHGDEDIVIPYDLGKAAFDHAASPKGLVTLFHGKHVTPALQSRAPGFRVVQTTTADFFDLYLKKDATAEDRLRRDANVEGVAQAVFEL